LERLRQIDLPPALCEQRDELCQLLLDLKLKIDKVEKELAAKAEADHRVRLLRTQYGIGPLTGLCLAHTLESPERFANPRKVTAYVGLTRRFTGSANRSENFVAQTTRRRRGHFDRID
jgi:transposase